MGKRNRSASKEAARERIEKKLDALYAELPVLDCKGKCHDVCTRIIISPGERARIRRISGIEIPPPAQMAREGCQTCPALKNRRCTVYEIRPMVCRLWGIDETMRCEYGCKPRGGWLSRVDAVRFSVRSYMIGGWPNEVPRLSPKDAAVLLRGGAVPGVFINERREHLNRPVLENPDARRRPGLFRRLRAPTNREDEG